VAEQHNLERQLYSSMPDTINCKQQSWLKDCEQINFLIKKHPSAPITISTADGVIHTFAADTPRAILNSMLNPSVETSQKVLEYKYSLDRMNSNSAKQTSSLFELAGTMQTPGVNIKQLIQEQSTITGIDLSNIVISIFVSSDSDYSIPVLQTLKSISSQNSGLTIQVYSVSSSLAWHENNITDNGFERSGLLSKTQVTELGITEFPTIVARNLSEENKRIKRMSGYLTKEEIILLIKSAARTTGDKDE